MAMGCGTFCNGQAFGEGPGLKTLQLNRKNAPAKKTASLQTKHTAPSLRATIYCCTTDCFTDPTLKYSVSVSPIPEWPGSLAVIDCRDVRDF